MRSNQLSYLAISKNACKCKDDQGKFQIIVRLPFLMNILNSPSLLPFIIFARAIKLLKFWSHQKKRVALRYEILNAVFTIIWVLPDLACVKRPVEFRPYLEYAGFCSDQLANRSSDDGG